MSKPTNTPQKFSTSAEGSEATILLYGTIGTDWWEMPSEDEKDNTAKEFVKAFRELDGKYERINLRIHSGGGSMYDGLAMVTAIREAKSEVHGYNDGLCASMAADIWLACPNRHMASNALLMIHEGLSVVYGNATQLREEADVLDKWNDAAINVMAESTGIAVEELKATYYDGKDHWLNHADVVTAGFITTDAAHAATDPAPTAQASKASAEAYSTEARFPAGIQNIPSRQLRTALKMQPAKVVVMAEPTQSNLLTQDNTITEMTIDEIKAALDAGTIDREALTAALAVEAPAPQPEPAAATATEPDVPFIAEEPEEMKALKSQVATMQAQVAKLLEAPGAEPTRTAAPEHSGGVEVSGTEKDEMAPWRNAMKKAAEYGGSVLFG